MADVDLDKARAAREAARAEAKRVPSTVTLGGEKFVFPVEMPLAALEAMEARNLPGFMRAMLGEEQWAGFVKHNPTLEDIEEIVDQVPATHGVTPGESSASGPS